MNSLHLSWFGKLPIRPDFIRHRVEGEEIKALDLWFQEGIHLAQTRLGRQWATTFHKSPPWQFVFQTPQSHCFLIGVALPSQDRSGRSYPFFIYCRINKKSFGASSTLAPLVFSEFFDLIQSEIVQCSGNDALNDLLDRLSERPLPDLPEVRDLEAFYRQTLTQETQGSLMTALFGDFEDARKYQLDLNLSELLRDLRGKTASELHFALKFPLIPLENVRQISTAIDIPYCFEPIFQSMKTATAPIFFWQRDPQKTSPALFAFFSPPTKKQWRALLAPDENNDAWFNLCASNAQEAEASIAHTPSSRRQILSDKSLSLSKVLVASQ